MVNNAYISFTPTQHKLTLHYFLLRVSISYIGNGVFNFTIGEKHMYQSIISLVKCICIYHMTRVSPAFGHDLYMNHEKILIVRKVK